MKAGSGAPGRRARTGERSGGAPRRWRGLYWRARDTARYARWQWQCASGTETTGFKLIAGGILMLAGAVSAPPLPDLPFLCAECCALCAAGAVLAVAGRRRR